MDLATSAWLALAAILHAAAALKAADRTGTAVALAAYGVPGRFALQAVGALVTVEAALAAGLAGGVAGAPYAAAGMLGGFLVAQVVALAQGSAGAPCGCFGAGGRLSRVTAGRTALLACACAALPLAGGGPRVPLVLTAAVAAAVVVLAAGRRSAPRGALEIDARSRRGSTANASTSPIRAAVRPAERTGATSGSRSSPAPAARCASA
jgi:hypothetical protein